jgi:hypothetical protein
MLRRAKEISFPDRQHYFLDVIVLSLVSCMTNKRTGIGATFRRSLYPQRFGIGQTTHPAVWRVGLAELSSATALTQANF